MKRARTMVTFGDITWESRVIIWLMVVGFVLEVLKVLAHHG